MKSTLPAPAGSPAISEAWLRKLDSIPTLPTVAARLIEMALNESTSTSELGDLLSKDPGLTAKLLKVVNSTSYGLRSEVTSVSHAVSIVGRQALRSLVLGISVFETFTQSNEKVDPREALWKHAVASAAAAQVLAESVGKVNVEEASIAGLMHDIGKVALDLLWPKEYREALAAIAASRNEDERAIEARYCGLDHTQVGDLLAERWALPAGIRAAICHHHAADGAAGLATPIRRIVALTRAADVMTYLCGYGSTDAVLPPDVDKITGDLIARVKQDSVLQRVKEEVKKSAEVFRYGESSDPETWQRRLYAANGELSKAFAELGETHRVQQRCTEFIVHAQRLLSGRDPVGAFLKEFVVKFSFDRALFLEASEDRLHLTPKAVATADGRKSTLLGRRIELPSPDVLPREGPIRWTGGPSSQASPVLAALGIPYLTISPVSEEGRIRTYLATDRGAKSPGANDAASVDATVHQLIAPSLSYFLVNDKLYKRAQYLSVTDVLTGVSNRRALLAFLESTNEAARSTRMPFCVVMLDLDHFKKFNDMCGHQAGDMALKLAAQTIRSHCRVEDCVGRYGGEEFCLVMPATSLKDGKIVAERVRRAVEAEGKSVSQQFGGNLLTISGGIAESSPTGERSEALLSRADAALYKAKQNGRNRIEAASPCESRS